MAEPGTRRIYSNAGFDLLGDHLAAVTGIACADYLRQALCEPLGLSATALVGPPHRGGESSVGDLAVVAAELLNPGRLVHPTTVAELATVQFPGLSGVVPGFGRQDHERLGPRLRDPRLASRRTGPGPATRRRRTGTSAGPARSSGSTRWPGSGWSCSPTPSSSSGPRTPGRRSRTRCCRPTWPGSRSARTAVRTAACRRRTARSAAPPGAGARPLGQQLQHPVVVDPAGRSAKCPTRRGDVEVADAHARRRRRARAGPSRPRSTRRCPARPQPGQRGRRRARSTHPSSRWRHRRRGPDRPLPVDVDARPVPLPVGHVAEPRRRRRHAHPGRRRARRGRRRTAGTSSRHDRARLRAGDLLLQHRRDQRVPHQPGARRTAGPACAGARRPPAGGGRRTRPRVVAAPSRAGRPSDDHAAPGPHACMTTVPSPRRAQRRSSPARPGSSPARQTAPSGSAEGRVAAAAAQRSERHRPGRRGRAVAMRTAPAATPGLQPSVLPTCGAAGSDVRGEPHGVRRRARRPGQTRMPGRSSQCGADAPPGRRPPRPRHHGALLDAAPAADRPTGVHDRRPSLHTGAVEQHRAVHPGARADRARPRRPSCRRPRARRARSGAPSSTSASPGRPGQRGRRRDAAHEVGRAAHEVGRACPCRASRRRRRARTRARPPPAAPGTSPAPPRPAGPVGMDSITDAAEDVAAGVDLVGRRVRRSSPGTPAPARRRRSAREPNARGSCDPHEVQGDVGVVAPVRARRRGQVGARTARRR